MGEGEKRAEEWGTGEGREEMIMPAAITQMYVTNICYVAGGVVTAVTHWTVQSL